MLRENGAEVAIKVQRPGVEPIILRDLFIFRTLASFVNGLARARLGCDAELVVDEFGQKLLEELDYTQVGACAVMRIVCARGSVCWVQLGDTQLIGKE